MGGAWSKWYLMIGSVEAGYIIFILVLAVSSLLNVAYLLPIVGRGFFRPLTSTEYMDNNKDEGVIKEAPGFCLLAMGITSLGCIVLFFYADTIVRLIEPVVLTTGQ